MKRYPFYLALLFGLLGAVALSNENQPIYISGKFFLFVTCVFVIFLIYFLNKYGLLTINLKAYRSMRKGYSFYKKKDHEEALVHYNKSIGLEPDYAAAYMYKAGALLELKRYEEALESSEKAVELRPKLAMPHALRCLSMLMLGRLEEAFELAEDALRSKLNSPHLFNIKGIVLTVQQKHEEALKEFDNAITIKSNIAQAYSNRGYSLACLNKLDEAVKTLEYALSLDKNLRPARQNLALALKMRNNEGDSLKAKAMLDDLISDATRDVTTACAYALLGQRERLLELSKELVVKEPIFRRVFFSGIEFKHYREDPEFVAVVGK